MIEIKIAKVSDLPEILDIYRYYVENTAITFEYKVPSLTEFTNRYQNIISKYPYIIAISQNEIVGFAYANAFHSRAAYNWAVETSIYVKNNWQKKGIGKKLYITLENILHLQGVTNLNACIASPIHNDQYLNKNSIEYHEHLGYQLVGEFHYCGYKFNTWYNMVWMEKLIGEHLTEQPPIKPFHEIQDLALKNLNLKD